MDRRQFLKAVGAGAVGMCVFGCSTSHKARAAGRLGGKPNIVVFIADDAGMDFGCYGNKGIKTPSIDALAASGLLCENAFLTSPQCSPSRTSMLSGQFAHTIGTEDLHTGLQEGTKILPFYLRQAGYFTGYMLKGHIGKVGDEQFDWTDKGFWPDYVEGRWYAKAMDNFRTFLDKAGNKPFFLWMGFVDPHRGYAEEEVEGNRAPKVNDPADTTVPPYLADTPATRRDLANYYDEITRMDAQIGQMLAELEKRNVRDETLVIFLSDNGMPFPGAKGTVYDAGIRTPLIFSWTGRIKPGTRYSHLLSTIDLAPTLLDVAGVAKPPQMYGKSITSVFSDQSKPVRQYVFAERNWHGCDEHIRCVRSEKYKCILNSYIEWPHGIPSDLSTSPSWYELKRLDREGKLTAAQKRIFACPRPGVELYDLENDPYEFENLADRPDYLDIGRRLAKELEMWREQTKDHPSHDRRKADKNDRVTGFPFSKKNPPGYWDD